MTDTQLFVRSVRNWDRFGTHELQQLDRLAGQFSDLSELVETFSRESPSDAKIIDFVRLVTVAGFDIRGELGQGGMAIVLRVFNRKADREEALKLLRPELEDDPQMRQRFTWEFRCLSILQKAIRSQTTAQQDALKGKRRPAVASEQTVVNSKQLPFAELYEADSISPDARYFTMELLEGETLRDRIMRWGPEPLYRAIEVTERIASALATLHSLGILHRDIKPSNVFITKTNRVVLLDFGVAIADGSAPISAAADPNLSSVYGQTAIGTLAYSSPRQLTDPRHVDASDDIYSLGCVLYFLLTGRHAFDDVTSLGMALEAHKDTKNRPTLPATLPEWEPADEPVKTPQRVVELFDRMIDPDHERRIGTARDLKHRLRLALGTGDLLFHERAVRGLTFAETNCLSAYLRHLRDEQLSFSKIPLVRSGLFNALETKEVFVEVALQQTGQEKGGNGEGEKASANPSKTVAVGTILSQKKKMILLGPPGGGKTTLLKRAALAFAEGLSAEIPGWGAREDVGLGDREMAGERRVAPQLIPIFLRLRNFAAYLLERGERAEDSTEASRLLDYVASYYQQEQRLDIPQAFFRKLLSQGGCAVFLDGLDEVPESVREDVARHVHSFISCYDFARPGRPDGAESARTHSESVPALALKESRRGNFFVLASRPRGYEEVANVLPRNEYAVCEVKSLSLPSIQTLLGNVLRAIEPNQAERRRDLENLFAAISSSRELTILAGNPMFCTSLVLVYKSKGAQLPKRRVDVFDEIVGLLLGHWKCEDRQVIVPDATDEDLEFANRDVGTAVKFRKERLSFVAHRMQVSPKRTEISVADLLKTLEEYLSEEEGKSDTDASETAKQFLKYSHERSGLFVEMEPQVFAFTHEGFREYLVAHSLANLREEELVNNVIRHIDDINWEQILLLTGAHPGVASGTRVYLLTRCVESAEDCLQKGDAKGWARRLTMAGKIAYDMGDHLSATYRVKLQKKMREAVMNSGQGLAARLELALTLDGIDSVTDTLYALAPLPMSGEGISYVGANLVSNGQYKRFLEADDYSDELYWANPFCHDFDGRPYSRAEESLHWMQDHQDGDRFPKFWSDSKIGIVHRGLPVVGVSWFEANAYCRWLQANWGKLEEGKVNRGVHPRRIRLSLEAEWRSVANEIFPASSTASWMSIANVGKVVDCSTPVGMFPQGTERRVADWIGNVWQWQANCFDRSLRAMAIRGGAFSTLVEDICVELRGNCDPSTRDSDLGFRILVEC